MEIIIWMPLSNSGISNAFDISMIDHDKAESHTRASCYLKNAPKSYLLKVLMSLDADIAHNYSKSSCIVSKNRNSKLLVLSSPAPIGRDPVSCVSSTTYFVEHSRWQWWLQCSLCKLISKTIHFSLTRNIDQSINLSRYPSGHAAGLHMYVQDQADLRHCAHSGHQSSRSYPPQVLLG